MEYRSQSDFDIDIVNGLLAPEVKRNMKYELFTNNIQNSEFEDRED